MPDTLRKFDAESVNSLVQPSFSRIYMELVCQQFLQFKKQTAVFLKHQFYLHLHIDIPLASLLLSS